MSLHAVTIKLSFFATHKHSETRTSLLQITQKIRLRSRGAENKSCIKFSVLLSFITYLLTLLCYATHNYLKPKHSIKRR